MSISEIAHKTSHLLSTLSDNPKNSEILATANCVLEQVRLLLFFGGMDLDSPRYTSADNNLQNLQKCISAEVFKSW